MSDNLELFGDDEIPADALERLADPEILGKWPQSLSDMLGVIEAAYCRAGDDQAEARRRAFRAVRALASYHGGRVFYLPKGEALDRALRDREIWERFDGKNHDALSREYDLNVVQIYRIIAEQRALARARNQPDLFGGGQHG
ncbi:Mor transcription activator family protein [Halomonas pacifica]|uniref:Mor transcription activator family protein n=1 Tax=Bisbaumannia pacifica TaxID=77098 RepID=UPI0023582065|nr:Mor transcription activator family protein [Halomonas pacifica]MDC8804235.1 Mor transcription activator family protein [Halomonas pacifica]